MDKIFKERFKNLEKKAPDHIWDHLLKEISEEGISTSKPSMYTKIGIVAAIIITAIVSTILLSPNKNTEVDNKIPIIENNDIIFQNTNIEKTITSTANKKVDSKQNKKVTNIDSNRNTKKKIEPQETTIQAPIIKIKQEKQDFKIIAPKTTCTGECLLKLDHNLLGEWKANNNVLFENINSSETKVTYSGSGKVLFTYLYNEQKDTFTVYFKLPLDLTYQITPEACGEENGKVEFNFPTTRQFRSVNGYSLNNNVIEHLIVNKYTFEIEDNYDCRYSYQVNIPSKNLKANIKYDALETEINYPIYFSTNVTVEDVDYIWNFGDGDQSFGKEPEHKYTKAGNYNVQLQLIKANCSETINKTIQIKDRTLEIPDIFTPNNDGKNDVFIVSIPENTTSFEAYILNREGQLIYKWTDPKLGWDGLMMNGQKAQSATYFYVIKGKDSTNKSFEYKSILELRR